MVNLYHGDSLEVMKKIPDNSIDLLIADPPYNLKTTGGGSINKIKKLNKSLEGVEKAKITNGYDIELFAHEFLRYYPSVRMDEFGTPKGVCPHHLGLKDIPCKNGCSACWNQSIY